MSLFRFLSLLFVLFSLPLVSVNAQAVNHKVTPRVIDLNVSARDILTEVIKIHNFAPNKISLFPSVNQVIIDEGGDIVDFSPASMSDNTVNPTSWIQIARTGLEIGPEGEAELPMTIKIDPNVKPGVYHLFIGFGTGRNRDMAEIQVQKGIAPGVIVTLSIDQDQNEFLKLNKFVIDRFIFKPNNNAVTYSLHNPGKIDVVPRGEIVISSPQGEEVASIQINQNGDILPPGQTTEIRIDMPIEGMMGKYKAFLSIDYGTREVSTVYDSAYFYVIPISRLILLFLILLILSMIGAWWWSRRSQNDVWSENEDGHSLPLYVKKDVSEKKDHDIDLSKNK